MKTSKTLVSLIGGLTVMACAKTSYQAANPSDVINNDQKIPINNPYSRPQCEIDYWDQSIDINLFSYEFASSGGFDFGFKGLIPGLGLDASLKIEKARLTMEVLPANVYQREESFNAQADDTDVKFGVSVDFEKFGVGFNNYSTTPVAKLARVGLMRSIEGLQQKILSKEFYKEWSTRVIDSPLDHRDEVTIQAGADAGISEGDEFQVFNINHKWKGGPSFACVGQYQGLYPYDRTKPVAILRAGKNVVSARQFATLTITDPKISNHDILPGALVVQAPPAKGKKLKQLARSIKINSITSSGKITLKNGRTVDLTEFMKRQISDVLQDKKWKNLYYMYEPN